MQERAPAKSVLDTQLFRDAFNASPIGIVVENFEGQPLFVNPAFCRFLGFTEEELRSKHCVDFSPKQDAERDWTLFQQLRAGTINHYQMEKRYFRRDGSLVWGSLSISLFKSRPTPLVLAMVEDITEKKTAEEALRVSEERLRLAQQAARIGTFEWNIETGTNTWTPELEEMYGLPRGGFGGTQTAWENLVHPDDRTRVIELNNWALKTGQPTTGEWRVVLPDGSVHWIAGSWQVFMNDSGEPSRMIGINIDITDRKRAEQALHAHEELLKIFVKNVPAAVAMLDREMRYLQVSDRWCTDYLSGKAQIVGRSHYELFPDMPERWKEVHRRALAGETLRADEDHWVGQDGSHWARWEVRPWNTPEGTVGGILILAEDITDRKQMEGAITGMTRKLIEAQEQERARIGRELHDDINQRLAMLAVELEQPLDPSEFQNRVQGFREELRQISDDVQALSHDLHSSKLEYLGVVAGIKSWCKEFAERQKMDVEFKSDVRTVLPLDVGRPLFRVLQEALHNAVKHSGVKRIEVELHEEAGEIHITIRDLGKGFDIEAARQGRGLGLTSMQERVRLVNGTIEIESKPMNGTTIHVRVPFGSEHPANRKVG